MDKYSKKLLDMDAENNARGNKISNPPTLIRSQEEVREQVNNFIKCNENIFKKHMDKLNSKARKEPYPSCKVEEENRLDVIYGTAIHPEFIVMIDDCPLFKPLTLKQKIRIKLARLIMWFSNKIGDKNV
jgi:hypothetical protein